MPKGPILSRDTYFHMIRGTGSGGNADRNAAIRHLDWNTVVTELGTCVEPRLIGQDWGHIIQLDVTDLAYNAVRFTDEGSFQNDFGTGGSQIPIDYNV